MNDWSFHQRRVVTTARDETGEDVIVVLEVTTDGYIAWRCLGAAERVLFDPLAASRVICSLRLLQAVALMGVSWSELR